MARLDFCVHTAELRSMVGDGRHDEARRRAIALLREGHAAKPFLEFVADLLDPPKRGRGAPARPPQRWLEIGETYSELRDGGATNEAALGEISDRFGCSVETARRAVGIYEDAKTPE